MRDCDTTPNRKAVNVFHGNDQLGYLSWQAAQAMGPELDAGQEVDGTVAWIDDEFRRVGITVLERREAETPW